MFTNATVTITRRGVGYDQTTGRRTAETAVVILQDAPCLVSLSKARRIPFSDGIRELVKVLYPLSFETYEEVAIEPGDQAEVTMRGSDASQSFTVEDANLSVGIRLARWKLDIERMKVPAANE